MRATVSSDISRISMWLDKPAPLQTVRVPVERDHGLIGIGGHLAVPPLPHHRVYGSVPRRFDWVKLGQDMESSFNAGYQTRAHAREGASANLQSIRTGATGSSSRDRPHGVAGGARVTARDVTSV